MSGEQAASILSSARDHRDPCAEADWCLCALQAGVCTDLFLPAFTPPRPPLSLVATGPWLTCVGQGTGVFVAAGARHPWKVSEEGRRNEKVPFGATGT